MPTVLQFRRGTTTQNNAFTGALGEITYDTTVDTLRVHDGSTAGGFAMVTAASTSTLTNKTLTSPAITTSIVPSSADGAAIGSASAEFSDLFLADGSVIKFGNDQDITLTHVADTGLILKNESTSGNSGVGAVLTMQTGDTDVAANNVLGSIQFQAPDEGTGTDAILVAGAVECVSEGDFSASNNATKISFRCGNSEAATEKAKIVGSTGKFHATPDSILLIKNSSGSTLKTVNGHAAI